MFVDLSSPNPNCVKTEYGRILTLAPKSRSVFSKYVSFMVNEMVGHPRSFYLTEVLFSIMELTCSVRNAFALCLDPFFTVHKSLMNLAYIGTCFIISRRGMLTLTC